MPNTRHDQAIAECEEEHKKVLQQKQEEHDEWIAKLTKKHEGDMHQNREELEAKHKTELAEKDAEFETWKAAEAAKGKKRKTSPPPLSKEDARREMVEAIVDYLLGEYTKPDKNAPAIKKTKAGEPPAPPAPRITVDIKEECLRHPVVMEGGEEKIPDTLFALVWAALAPYEVAYKPKKQYEAAGNMVAHILLGKDPMTQKKEFVKRFSDLAHVMRIACKCADQRFKDGAHDIFKFKKLKAAFDAEPTESPSMYDGAGASPKPAAIFDDLKTPGASPVRA